PYYTPQRFELAIDLEYEDPDLSVPPELGAAHSTTDTVDTFAFDASALDSAFGDIAPKSNEPSPAEPPRYDHAVTLLASGESDAALAEIDRVLGAGGDRVDGLTLLGEAYTSRGALGEALDRYRGALAEAPASSRALAGEVRVLLALGRGAEALTS